MAILGFALPVLADENASVEDEANASSSVVVAESNASHDELATETNASKEAKIGEGKAKAYVIPVRDQIGGPILDILRRGLKDAIRAEATTVILDMHTPGGELGVTLEIMQEIVEAFERFEGPIITYVNTEAISAGAYIAVATNEIAFAPYGQIGAAEAVSGGGGNIDSSMKRKVNSYLKAKIRSFTVKHRYRARVMAAMMDANETLFIEGEQPLTADGSPIQGEGELLTLTAEEAVMEYGEPPQPLLGTGIYKTIEDLLAEKYGEGNYEVVRMEVNWAEELGLWLNSVGPIIMGLGMLLLFIEFKTPGFGVFGASGLVLLMIFFGSKYVAGFAGYEEVIVFLLGAMPGGAGSFSVPRIGGARLAGADHDARLLALGNGRRVANSRFHMVHRLVSTTDLGSMLWFADHGRPRVFGGTFIASHAVVEQFRPRQHGGRRESSGHGRGGFVRCSR